MLAPAPASARNRPGFATRLEGAQKADNRAPFDHAGKDAAERCQFALSGMPERCAPTTASSIPSAGRPEAWLRAQERPVAPSVPSLAP